MLSLFSEADEVENCILSENAVVDNTDKQKVWYASLIWFKLISIFSLCFPADIFTDCHDCKFSTSCSLCPHIIMTIWHILA